MPEILLEVDLHDPVRDNNAVRPYLIICFDSVVYFLEKNSLTVVFTELPLS
jgi:hypothetical protein